VVIREFQSMCLALRSPAIRTGNPLPKQAVRSTPISGWGGRKVSLKDLHRFAGHCDLNGSDLQMGRPRTGTEWWTIPRRTRMALLPPAVGLSVRWQT
jgi:hypothetical protein